MLDVNETDDGDHFVIHTISNHYVLHLKRSDVICQLYNNLKREPMSMSQARDMLS